MTRILVFGTFDMLHPGHLDFFAQARSLTSEPFLVVSLARDVNVLRLKEKLPRHSETQRLETVRACELVDEAQLGAIEDYITHIVDLKPDIIALGYDQEAYTENLYQLLEARGLQAQIIRLQAFHPESYKTSKLIGKQI